MVSVRLDARASHALDQLRASGLSASEAVREALVALAATRRLHDQVRAEVAALELDEDDRREMREVAALMEALSAKG